MKRRLSVLSAVLVVGVVVCAPAAVAADPGRWRATGVSRIPLEYFQGMTSAPDRSMWFDGVILGLYRTDPRLDERRRNEAVVPPDVTAREGYNHVGDITWDAREGGRILLPLECYYPGRAEGANSCRTGAIGVADPLTLRWRYYVKLDPAEIPKAMWAEVSPDGRRIWTSSGADLLAYRTRDVVRRRAAPAAAPIRAVRRLVGAAPGPGITGAAFYGDRLLMATQDDTLFRVWSVDLTTGRRRLEIERTIVGESEGLDVVDALGGVLHWIVTPFDPQGRDPTYAPPGNALLHFASTMPRRRLRLSATPRTLTVGRRTRVTFTATVRRGGRRVRVAGAVVRFDGQVERTSAAGTVHVRIRPHRAGRHRARATRADLRPATIALTALTPVTGRCATAICFTDHRPGIERLSAFPTGGM
ncbi:MAG TPA: hypothetical protein VFM58_01535 [Solirubrobacteraceae bacterium]|nr:hypothetical protein [Solirubrobacteraceae bacterium]